MKTAPAGLRLLAWIFVAAFLHAPDTMAKDTPVRDVSYFLRRTHTVDHLPAASKRTLTGTFPRPTC